MLPQRSPSRPCLTGVIGWGSRERIEHPSLDHSAPTLPRQSHRQTREGVTEQPCRPTCIRRHDRQDGHAAPAGCLVGAITPAAGRRASYCYAEHSTSFDFPCSTAHSRRWDQPAHHCDSAGQVRGYSMPQCTATAGPLPAGWQGCTVTPTRHTAAGTVLTLPARE
jgi:hypothetical protein